MNKYSRQHLKIEERKIKFNDEVIVEIVPHRLYKTGFQLKYQDGELSNGFWNIQWAKEHAISETLRILEDRQIEGVGNRSERLTDVFE